MSRGTQRRRVRADVPRVVRVGMKYLYDAVLDVRAHERRHWKALSDGDLDDARRTAVSLWEHMAATQRMSEGLLDLILGRGGESGTVCA